MFKNVIVGIDGRGGGRDALALAEALRGIGGELTLVSVYPREPFPWRGSSAAYEAVERNSAREVLERTRAEAGVQAQLRSHGSSSVGRGLHELAEEIGADLLVLGSSRRGLVGRVLVGDDTRAALDGAPCAIAIAPCGYSQHPDAMREIGVGYDGSPESEHALAVARKLASERHTALSALEAVSLPAYTFAGPPIPDEGTIAELVQQAHERVEQLRDIEPHATYGQPAEELALYSASLDLLVIGSRGYGPLGRLLHGSTAQELARSARCPLLVLTRADREVQSVPADGRAVATATTA